jgi:hypothetical protein
MTTPAAPVTDADLKAATQDATNHANAVFIDNIDLSKAAVDQDAQAKAVVMADEQPGKVTVPQ